MGACALCVRCMRRESALARTRMLVGAMCFIVATTGTCSYT